MARTLLLVAVLLQGSTGEVAVHTDNLAVAQGDAPRFTLPAPGLRHRPKQLLDPQDNFVDNGMAAMPQVVTLDVACLPDQMKVRLVFDTPFNGILYSKGFYGDPRCTYVAPNTAKTQYEFTVSAGQCGSSYVDAAPPYLHNTIVIQNEPTIQEIWDSARGVRCVYEQGGIDTSHRVSAGLNVAMLDQQVVSFAAQTKASASLDIQLGRGPFAPSASGMVKIGELMTLVVTVEGPDTADVLVRQCVAHDGTRTTSYQLTDEAGCVLGSKRKVLAPWQKTRSTGRSDVPVVTYAHFQAFKFPDKNDVYIECQVDLCNGQCPSCLTDQPSGRRKRAVVSDEDDRRDNSVGDGVRVTRRLRVLSPDDISITGDDLSTVTLVTKSSDASSATDVCMSVSSFVCGLVVMLVVLISSSVLTAVLCLRVRTIPSASSTYPPDSSFHAFSTVSGKTR